MMSFRRLVGTFRAIFLAAALTALAVAASAEEKIVYNKYNIHAQDKGGKRYIASYANYTAPGAGHVIIPPGTPLVVEDAGRKEIVFRSTKDDARIEFEYHEPRMGMSAEQYLEKITSPKPVSLGKLSKEDRKGIEEGKAYPGMTRDGVLAALGYPAAHKTPSLDGDTWIYWTNRFGTVAVEFDGKKVVKVRQ